MMRAADRVKLIRLTMMTCWTGCWKIRSAGSSRPVRLLAAKAQCSASKPASRAARSDRCRGIRKRKVGGLRFTDGAGGSKLAR
jgi:hypothetical protein